MLDIRQMLCYDFQLFEFIAMLLDHLFLDITCEMLVLMPIKNMPQLCNKCADKADVFRANSRSYYLLKK